MALRGGGVIWHERSDLHVRLIHGASTVPIMTKVSTQHSALFGFSYHKDRSLIMANSRSVTLLYVDSGCWGSAHGGGLVFPNLFLA